MTIQTVEVNQTIDEITLSQVVVNSVRGEDGRKIELQSSDAHIQWRHEDGEWEDLVALSALTGPAGQEGADGRGFNPLGMWSIDVDYEVDDIVTRSGGTFRAHTPNGPNTTAGIIDPAGEVSSAVWEMWSLPVKPVGKNPITGMYHLGDNGGFAGERPEDVADLPDSSSALQALVEAVPYGSTIYLDGYFRIDTSVKWRSGVSMKSAHQVAGGLVAYTVDSAPIRWTVSQDGASSGAPLTDCTFESFEIDCSNQTLSSGYNVGAKGIVIQYMKRCRIHNLYVHDSHATGIGVDFMFDGCRITENVVVNCGRSHSSTSPTTGGGGGGCIGIGTMNNNNEEACTIANNICFGTGGSTPNTTYGIFLESQSSGQSNQTSGYRIIGNYISGCQVGIGESGARRTVVIGNTITKCGAGIGVDNGTINSNHQSYDGVCIGNEIYGCMGPGIRFDWRTSGGKYFVTSNVIAWNGGEGILFWFDGTVNGAAVNIVNNKIYDNKSSGIRAHYPDGSGTGGFTESEFSGNFIYNNGINKTAGNRDGIRLEVLLSKLTIKGNVVFDRQASKTQGYALVISAAAGEMIGGGIVDNDFRDNATGAVSIATPVSSSTWVARNAGYASPAVAVTADTSPMVYTAPEFPSYLIISGGTVSAVELDSMELPTSGILPLEPGDEVTITYGDAPTLAMRGR